MRERRGDVERDLVLVREDGHGVGADLVGSVAVGGDAIGADDDEIDVPGAHQRSGHALGDDRGVDAVAHQLPGGQPRALEKRSRLVGDDGNLLALLDGCANDAERRSVAGGRERAGVAVRQHPRAVRDDGGAEASHRAAAGDVLVVNRACLALETKGELVGRLPRLRTVGERLLHAIDRPEQVDSGRPRRRHHVADLLQLDGVLARAFGRCSSRMPSAMPIAAATPIAGAPRITIVRIARATSWADRQRTYTSWPGSLR